MLSRFVYETENSLFHSVTQKQLPINSSQETLEEFFFFEHQNKKAIESRLAVNPTKLQLTLIPTWECNLRCSHCCVTSLLKKRDTNKIDHVKLYYFLCEYFTKFPSVKKYQGYFLGGESFIYPNDVIRLMKVCETVQVEFGLELIFGITTNLAFELTMDHIKAFQKIKTIAVSVDGLEKEHNKQRHAFMDKFNPFERTINNIKRLVALGMRDRIHIQAALNEEYLNEDYVVKFAEFITSLGVPLENMIVGSIFPTKAKPQPQKYWLNYKTKSLFMKNKPCCKYQYMGHIQINPDNTLYDNFYTTTNSQLGTLDDSIESICQKNMDLIFGHMPALGDSNCLSCPALGYCWGGCVNAHVLVGDKPSKYCNKDKIVPHIAELAKQGNLIRYKGEGRTIVD